MACVVELEYKYYYSVRILLEWLSPVGIILGIRIIILCIAVSIDNHFVRCQYHFDRQGDIYVTATDLFVIIMYCCQY